uniref:Movement protein n=1 Tax=Syphacia muris TaxID=451379 RepID=A0A0N5AX12_9BILA
MIIAAIVIIILNLLGCILILLLRKVLLQRNRYNTSRLSEISDFDERIIRIVERTVEEVLQRHTYNNSSYRIPSSPHVLSKRYEYRSPNIPRLKPPETPLRSSFIRRSEREYRS